MLSTRWTGTGIPLGLGSAGIVLRLLRPKKLLTPPDLAPSPSPLPLEDRPRLWEREWPAPPSDSLRPSSEMRRPPAEREGERVAVFLPVMCSPTEFQSRWPTDEFRCEGNTPCESDGSGGDGEVGHDA